MNYKTQFQGSISNMKPDLSRITKSWDLLRRWTFSKEVIFILYQIVFLFLKSLRLRFFSLGLVIETHIFSVSVSVSSLRLGLFSLGLVIETSTFSVSVSSLRLRHFQSRSRSRHWDLDFSVSVSSMRLRHFQSRSRSRWSKSGLANPWSIGCHIMLLEYDL